MEPTQGRFELENFDGESDFFSFWIDFFVEYFQGLANEYYKEQKLLKNRRKIPVDMVG